MPTASNITRLHPDRDSESLSEPFLPPDVDLAGFSYLPVTPDRITSSTDWRRAKREPLYGFRFMSLFLATFRQHPVGSLPNDDEALADILGMDDERWAEIKEATMRSWTLCADGRWHHPLAAHCVSIAWAKHRTNTKRTVKANEANAKAKATRDAGRDALRDADVTSHQGEEGEESKETIERNVNSPSNESRSPTASQVAFAAFWEAWPNKVGKPVAEKAFQRALKRVSGDADTIMAGLERYKAGKPADRQWMNPATFLNGDRFNDEPAPPADLDEVDPMGVSYDPGDYGLDDKEMRRSAHEKRYGKFGVRKWKPSKPTSKGSSARSPYDI